MIEINSNGYKKRSSQRYNRHCIPRMIYREIMKYYEEGFKMFSGHQKAVFIWIVYEATRREYSCTPWFELYLEISIDGIFD